MDLFSDAANAFIWAYKLSSIPLICKFAIKVPPLWRFHEKVAYFMKMSRSKYIGFQIINITNPILLPFSPAQNLDSNSL